MERHFGGMIPAGLQVDRCLAAVVYGWTLTREGFFRYLALCVCVCVSVCMCVWFVPVQ